MAAVLVAAVTAFVTSTLPPKHLSLADPAPDDAIAGVIHVHSIRSDGRGTPDEIAEAAAQAGLKFVVITDHGDATRTPEPPAYRHGVLCLDAVEISTSGGHYIALDMPASPYPLGGEARDVVEDVKRLGGFGIVAHPDSPKDELRWREWTAPFDAVEIVNLDTAWRQRAAGPSWRQKLDLAARLFSYPIRPEESIASLVAAIDDLGTVGNAGEAPSPGHAGGCGRARARRLADDGRSREPAASRRHCRVTSRRFERCPSTCEPSVR